MISRTPDRGALTTPLSRLGRRTSPSAAGALSVEAAAKETIVWPHIPLYFPGTASIAVGVDGPSWVAARLAPSAGLAVVQASRQARCDPERRRPWPTSKQRAAQDRSRPGG